MKKRYVVTRADGTEISIIGDEMWANAEAGMVFISAEYGGTGGRVHHETVAVLNIAEIIGVVSADASPASLVP